MSTSASGNSGNESNATPRPNPDVTNGAVLHSCEHCRDFTLDFGLSNEEMEEICTGKSLRKSESIQRSTSNLKRLRGVRTGGAILSVSGAQIHQKAEKGCELYATISSRLTQCRCTPADVIFAYITRDALVLQSYKSNDSIISLGSFRLFVPDDNPLSEYILGRPLRVDPWSKSTRDQVRQWLKPCDTPDNIRQYEEDCFSPTHLIELSPCLLECSSECCGFTLRLKKNTQGPVSYAALSYCWGGNQRLKATKSNIQELLNNIPYAEMPATLQDAARVAFDLSFRYIWIDALCLIQDLSIDEIHTLIAEIPNIYRHATLTIAAKSTHAAGEGFLHPRNIRKSMTNKTHEHNYECQIAIKNLFGKSEFAMLQLYSAANRTPINDRAWTLQEQVLSQRYLSFSDLITQWQSYKSPSQDESGADEDFSSRQSIPDNQYPDVFIYEWNIHNASKVFNRMEKNFIWTDLVKRYTKRSLSNIKDRPIAISALANVFGDAQDYIAGLWLSNLCQGLSWSCFSQSKEIVACYYAPSWSWWSVNGEVHWSSDILDMHRKPRFRLVDCESRLAHSSAPFGYLVDAWLRVEARCGKVFVSDHELGEEGPAETLKLNYGTFESIQWPPENESYHFHIIWDRTGMCFKGQVLRYLVLLVSSLHRSSKAFGIILVEDERSENEQGHRFRRVGTFSFKNEERGGFTDWLDKQPVETLTLV